MDFAPRIVAWQRQHGRHDLPWQNTRDPYRIWLSEIMLQQTQVATVIPYYERFLQRFPDVAALAAAAQEDVMPYWAGLGYYARARNLHRCAQEIAVSYTHLDVYKRQGGANGSEFQYFHRDLRRGVAKPNARPGLGFTHGADGSVRKAASASGNSLEI